MIRAIDIYDETNSNELTVDVFSGLFRLLSIRLYIFWYDVIRIINVFRRTILIQLLSLNIVVWHIPSNDNADDDNDNNNNRITITTTQQIQYQNKSYPRKSSTKLNLIVFCIFTDTHTAQAKGVCNQIKILLNNNMKCLSIVILFGLIAIAMAGKRISISFSENKTKKKYSKLCYTWPIMVVVSSNLKGFR